MTTAAPAIELADLSKTYGRGDKAVPAVKHVSLSVGAGEVYGFLGPNGAGKSTTIRMLLGLIRPTGGEARLFGRSLASDPNLLRRVGSLVDGGNFYPFLSGRRNLEVLARTHGGGHERIEPLLEEVGLGGAPAARKVKGYSTGMRQRLGVAAALLNDPDIVILDEPANGLDAAGIQEMRQLIRRLAEQEGKCIFLSSHLLHEVQQLCDRVAIISNGAMIHEAHIADLLRTQGFRVTATPLDVAEPALASRWAVRRDGDALLVDAPHEEAPEIARRLVGAGADLFALVPAERNLEEVFLAMTTPDPGPEASHA